MTKLDLTELRRVASELANHNGEYLDSERGLLASRHYGAFNPQTALALLNLLDKQKKEINRLEKQWSDHMWTHSQ